MSDSSDRAMLTGMLTDKSSRKADAVLTLRDPGSHPTRATDPEQLHCSFGCYHFFEGASGSANVFSAH